MRTHWCRRHPGWHLPINEHWHRASRPCAPGEGTLVVCVVCAGKTKVLAVVLCVGVRQTTPSNAYSAKPLPAVASGLLVRPMGSSVAKQPLQGLTAQPLARWLRAGADGFIAAQAVPAQYRHVHDGAVSKQGHTLIPAKVPAHGQSPLVQRGYTRHLGLFNPLLGACCFERHPIVRGLANSWVSFRYSLQQHWLSLDPLGQSSIDQACTVKQQRPRRAFA